MTTTEFQHNGTDVTEKRLSYDECREIYGTANVPELNEKFNADAQRATDGNCSQWAVYAVGGITIVTEC